jgi:tRNA-splicing ligase RtcB
MDYQRENNFLIRVPKRGAMRVEALIFARREIPIEEGAVSQLRDGASLPTVAHALGMPDMHVGYGVPIGSVVATREEIVPAAVGYDINCGMRLLLTSLSMREVDVIALAEAIHRDIPLGEGRSNVSLNEDDFAAVLEGGLSALVELRPRGHRVWEVFDREEERKSLGRVEDRGSMVGLMAAVPGHAVERGRDQLATLGGGNHFIELQEVETIYQPKIAERLGLFVGQFAIMIHSGSRGFGHEVGGHYMKLAKQYNDHHGGGNPSPHLGFLPAGERPGQDYLAAMRAAANFAFANRALMGALAAANVRARHPEARLSLVYDVPHNIAKWEDHQGGTFWVHRKGATRAYDQRRMAGTPFADLGQPVLIPGSMGTASYVLVGAPAGEKSLYSVNHGAGRVMSRTQAAGGRRGRGHKREAAISDEEFKRSMEGVYLVSADRRAVKEEAPAAYKDIDAVIETVREAGLATPVARLVPRAVLKG